MPEIDFCGPAYRLETPNASCDVCRNLYPEKIEKGPRAGKFRLRNIPGLPLFATLPTKPVRALWTNPTSCFAVAGGTLYQIFADASFAAVGPVAPGTNPAIIQSNGFQLAIASAGEAFIAPGGGQGVLPIRDTLGDPINAATIAFLDNYFVAGIANTKQVQISKLAPAGATWDPGDVADKEAYSDNVQRVWVDQPGGEYLWLFGNETTEVWTDTAGLFPFSRVPNLVFPIGCDSAWSVAGAGGYRAWLWRGIIWGCAGFSPQRISDFGVEEAIRTYPLYDQQNAEAFAYIERGHIFYVISFPVAGKSWCYDVSTQMWHERLYFSNGAYSRYRPRVYAKFLDMHLVGDYQTGDIYKLDPTVYTDAKGAPLRRQRICPYVTDSLKNDRYNRFSLDMDTGIGLEVAQGQPGFDPQVVMRYSKDRGKNWSNERQSTLGEVGQDETRVFWPQLGSSRIGMTFDVVITDPVPTSINGALLDIGPGRSPGNRPTS